MVDGLLVLAIILISFVLSDISLRRMSITLPFLFFLLVAFIILYPEDETTRKGLIFVLLTSVLSALIVKETCCNNE